LTISYGFLSRNIYLDNYTERGKKTELFNEWVTKNRCPPKKFNLCSCAVDSIFWVDTLTRYPLCKFLIYLKNKM
jgi:hypothetical protein